MILTDLRKSAPAHLAALVLGILIGKFAIPGGSSGHPSEGHPAGTVWTCAMHPQIQQPKPGKCPYCGMDLTTLKSHSGHNHGQPPRQLTLDSHAKALAEIQTTEVRREFPEVEVRLVGKIDFDETREKSLSARFPARIDELFVNYTGIPVKSGEHLAVVYSPDLLSAEREFLTAHRSGPDSSITRAAREKLRLWDLLPDQIDAILEKGEASDRFVLKAPTGGIVVAKNVKEGDYVQTGQPLFRIVDLSVLWVYLSAYESDLPWLRYGQTVEFTVEGVPGESFHGQIAFIEPELDRKTRTAQVRVTVHDPDPRLKPGMFVRGVVVSRLAGHGKVYSPELAGKWISPMHPEIISDQPGKCSVCGMDLVPVESLGYLKDGEKDAPLVIPTSAALRTGERAIVYVEVPDAPSPSYEGREVLLGPRAGNLFMVVEGLKEGERVVTRGAFKIDSALQIQARPSMMNPPPPPPRTLFPEGMAPLLWKPYLAMEDALVKDALDAAKAEANGMMDLSGHDGPLAELLHKMLAAPSLEQFRKPHFETLSNAFIDAAQETPALFNGDLYLMYCPMVHGDHGASWLQGNKELANPYFGASMLKCGTVKGNLKAKE